MLISKTQLLQFAPYARFADVAAANLDLNMQRCEINTPRRIRHFMAQLFVESQGFSQLEENLNYSPLRLTQVWPSRFPTTVSAMPFARNPRALAQKVYGGRMGNNTLLDGWLYRGGGYLMLTGKNNYRNASGYTGSDLVNHPEFARTPIIASVIACNWWQLRGLNELVDKDPDEVLVKTLAQEVRINERDDVVEATYVVNGSDTDLAAREAALLAAARIWN